MSPSITQGSLLYAASDKGAQSLALVAGRDTPVSGELTLVMSLRAIAQLDRGNTSSSYPAVDIDMLLRLGSKSIEIPSGIAKQARYW